MKVFCHFCDIGQVNTYLVTAGERDCKALVVDPGDLDNGLIEIIESHHLEVAGILVTHDHLQHVAGIGKYMKIYPCPVYSYRSRIMGFSSNILRETYRLDIQGFSVDVLHVAGHSDDSLVYVIGNAIFTGDTLAAGRVSSTTSMSAKATLIRNINARIMTYDDNYLVFPGHGCPTKIRIERMLNHDLLESEVSLSEDLFQDTSDPPWHS